MAHPVSCQAARPPLCGSMTSGHKLWPGLCPWPLPDGTTALCLGQKEPPRPLRASLRREDSANGLPVLTTLSQCSRPRPVLPLLGQRSGSVGERVEWVPGSATLLHVTQTAPGHETRGHTALPGGLNPPCTAATVPSCRHSRWSPAACSGARGDGWRRGEPNE